MGKKSTATKNNWNASHYERIAVSVPLGERDRYKQAAESLGLSVNQLFITAVEEFISEHLAQSVSELDALPADLNQSAEPRKP